MSVSKKVTYIPSFLIDTANDSLRNELSAHWSRYKKSDKFSRGTQLIYLADNPKLDETPGSVSDFAFTEELDIGNTELPFKTVSMRVYGHPAKFTNQKHWRAYFGGGTFDGETHTPKIDTDIDFTDSVFTCEKPLTEKEAIVFGGSSLVKTYDVDLEYNFFQESYEKMTVQSRIHENTLPNLYTLYSYKEEEANEDMKTTPIFKEHVTLNGFLDDNKANQFTDKGRKNPKASNSLQYLASYAEALRRRRADGHRNIIQAYENTMFPPSNMSLFGYNNKKEMFPMFGDVRFATDKTTQFTQILQDSNTSCVFMKDICQSLKGQNNIQFQTKGYSTHVENPVLTENELGTKTITHNSTIKTENAKVWDIMDWYVNFQSTDATPMENNIFLGFTNKDAKMATTNQYGFYKKMMETIFIGKLRTLIKSQQRRFADIIDGDSAYAEEVFYKIEKYVTGTDLPIQTYWIPNTNQVDIINFIDTQVKYSKEYTYKASVFKLVIGSSYRYSNLALTKRVTEECVEFISVKSGEPVKPRVPGSVTVSNISGVRTAIEVQNDKRYMAEFDVTITPKVLLYELPFFSVTSRLIDDPPLAPEIDILPYRSDSRFLKFFMQGSTGEQLLHPITMTDRDRRMVSMIRKARNLDNNEPITYKSDDYPSYFEVYRIDEPPTSYRSFVGHQRAALKTDISDQTQQKAASIAYVEQINPNTKYYYMFRSVDVHGKIGYPSPVYEVEMLNDKGAFYPIVKIHEINPRSPRVTKKSGRRFVQIVPNIGQTLINESKSGFENYTSAKDLTGELTYGFKAESIWDKKFKVRLTSRKTGKKIDLNLQFRTKRVKTDFEESS